MRGREKWMIALAEFVDNVMVWYSDSTIDRKTPGWGLMFTHWAYSKWDVTQENAKKQEQKKTATQLMRNDLNCCTMITSPQESSGSCSTARHQRAEWEDGSSPLSLSRTPAVEKRLKFLEGLSFLHRFLVPGERSCSGDVPNESTICWAPPPPNSLFPSATNDTSNKPS